MSKLIHESFVVLEESYMIPPRLENFLGALSKEVNIDGYTKSITSYWTKSLEFKPLEDALKRAGVYNQNKFHSSIPQQTHALRSKFIEFFGLKLVEYNNMPIEIPEIIKEKKDFGVISLFLLGNSSFIKSGGNSATAVKSGGKLLNLICYEENLKKYESFVKQYNEKLFKIVDYEFVTIPKEKGYHALNTDEFCDLLVSKCIEVSKNPDLNKRTTKIIEHVNKEMNNAVGESLQSATYPRMKESDVIRLRRWKSYYDTDQYKDDLTDYLPGDSQRWDLMTSAIVSKYLLV